MVESHVVSGLVAKRGELAGEAERHRRELHRLADELVHLEATIRLFAPDYDLGGIRVRRRRHRHQWFKPGECQRLALEVLRDAPGPLSDHGVRGSGSGCQALRAAGIALPIAAPVPMRAGVGALGQDVGEDRPVGPAPGVLTIGRLVGVVGEVGQTEVVVLADLHPAKTRDVRLRLVVGRPVPARYSC